MASKFLNEIDRIIDPAYTKTVRLVKSKEYAKLWDKIAKKYGLDSKSTLSQKGSVVFQLEVIKKIVISKGGGV